MLVYTNLLLGWIALASANPIGDPELVKRACANGPYNCLLNYFSYQPSAVASYCTSALRVTKTSTTRVTTTVYSTTITRSRAPTVTVDGTQSVTSTEVQTDVSTVPDYTTTVSTEFTATATVLNTVATSTSVETDVSTVYTCEVTNTPTNLKRQVTSTPSSPIQITCPGTRITSFNSASTSSGCSCVDDFTKPTTTLTTTSTTTRTRALTISTVTATNTPVITVTSTMIRVSSVPVSVTASEIYTTTVDVTATESSRTTSFVTTTSAAPSAFALWYLDSNNNDQYGHVSTEADRPGSAGTLIRFSPDSVDADDQFALNAQKQLTAGNKTAERNEEDPYPYLFLREGSDDSLTPQLSVCNGLLVPRDPGSSIAVCNGFLALGNDTVFDDTSDSPPCERIELEFLEIPQAT